MDSVDCPFRTAEAVLREVGARARVVFVDMHAEATSEKGAMGWFLDGKVAAVLGSHSHVQTADERAAAGRHRVHHRRRHVRAGGSVIGVKKELAMQRFLTHMPVKFEVAGGPVVVQGVIVDVDAASGRAQAIRRVREMWERWLRSRAPSSAGDRGGCG